MNERKSRTVHPIAAFLAQCGGAGLGYVYVGRLDLGLMVYVVTWAVFALAGWSRAMLWPSGIYGVVAFEIVLGGVAIIHPAMLAHQDRHRKARPYNRWWFYVFWIVGTCLIGYSTVLHRAQLFGYETFRAPSDSMSPTIENGDVFMVDTWRYGSDAPVINDIVVYHLLDKSQTSYLKRIVGLPGDRLEEHAAVLYRNGQRVSEPYLHAPNDEKPYGRDFEPLVVGAGEVYVLGDNRDLSVDSRSAGPLPIGQIHGRAEYVWLSHVRGIIRWNRFGSVLRP